MSSSPKLKKYTLRLHDGDPEELERFFPNAGYNKVVRQMVRKLVNQLREKENQSRPAEPDASEIDTSDILGEPDD